jgi:hypothetical protein
MEKLQAYIDLTTTTLAALDAEARKISRYDVESEASRRERAVYRVFLGYLEDIKRCEG